jgi:hypothetical protein
MEKIAVVTVGDLARTMEQNIGSFIVRTIDKSHFGFDECEDEGFNDCEDFVFDFDLYDRDQINAKLRGKNKKKLAKITFAGAELYKVVMSFDIKINRNAFTCLAFLKDLNEGHKSL